MPYFRLLLTRDSTETFKLIMDVVKQVIKAAQENLEGERQKQRGTPFMKYTNPDFRHSHF